MQPRGHFPSLLCCLQSWCFLSRKREFGTTLDSVLPLLGIGERGESSLELCGCWCRGENLVWELELGFGELKLGFGELKLGFEEVKPGLSGSGACTELCGALLSSAWLKQSHRQPGLWSWPKATPVATCQTSGGLFRHLGMGLGC